MRIGVTGGAGFVGSSIVRRLLVAGHHVLVIDDLSTGKIENIEGCGCDFHHTDAGVADYRQCDAIVHAAAYADVSKNWADPGEARLHWAKNAELTARILERCNNHRFVFLSTCSVYAGGDLVSELIPPRATSLYAATKIAAEALVSAYTEAHRIDGCALRLVNVVGTRYAHGHIADFVRQARLGRVHALDDGKKAKTFVHVEDVADAVAEALGDDECLPRNVVGSAEWSWHDTITVMRELRPECPFTCTWEARPSGWIGDPKSLVVRSIAGTRGKRSIRSGVVDALKSLGWAS